MTAGKTSFSRMSDQMPHSLLAVSSFDRRVEIEGQTDYLWKHEVRELLRGFAGALFVALPLLYTLEMWERSRNIEEPQLLLILLIAFVLNMGYNSYSGFKAGGTRTNLVWDSVLSLALGAMASFITLCITARIELDTPPAVMVSLIALMIVPTSFGASLAINQLGARDGEENKNSIAYKRLGEDGEKLLATFLGSVLFAFNIGPTIEPKLMLAKVGSWHALAILGFSVLISYGIEFTARFNNMDDNRTGVLAGRWLCTLVCYLVSLGVSAGLLWAFGYIGPSTPPEMWLPWVIIVGYATTLGGTAGRLVL